MDAKRPSVVISDSSALEFIFKRSRSWSRVVRKVLVINKTSSAIVHSYSFTEVGLLLTYSNLVQVPGVVVILCSMCVPVPATSAAVETVFSHGGFSCVHIGPVWDIRSSQTWSLPSATNI